ncbi:unnamed protein product [Triticum turgidum subsp. durum]|uniref:Magnesium transporter n=1 Tax=Triticum turgidum subsp. durum TaxID=4567 RepID=A0A9R1AZX9_TRITD|nr:unnamed protein product [Triticum turgidum subsp. durum]
MQKQSPKQILALALLITAAVLLSIGESSRKGASGGSSDYVLLYGILPVTVASVLSGLASSLCQWASQVKKHTSYMMTIEMSFIGSMCLLASTFQSPDGEALRIYGFFHEWTLWTVGFVIVSALLVTALLQFIFDGKPPSLHCLVALPLVMTSIFIYQKYPYVDNRCIIFGLFVFQIIVSFLSVYTLPKVCFRVKLCGDFLVGKDGKNQR